VHFPGVAHVLSKLGHLREGGDHLTEAIAYLANLILSQTVFLMPLNVR
jgi:hypothetical protein